MTDSLDKLTIRGFKSIRELIDFELKRLNIFVGANGAGKSNLISFFRMLQSFIKGNIAWLEEYSVGELWTKNVIQGGTTHE